MTNPIRRAWALVPLALFALVMPARAQETDAEWLDECEEWRNGEAIHCEIRPLEVRAIGSIDAAVRNGVIDLRGTESGGVQVRARVRAWADSEAEARELAGRVRVIVDGARLRADGPSSDHDEGWTVDFVGTLPRRYDVTLRTQNGPVTLRQVSGRIDVEAQNGPVDLRDVGGVVHAAAANGPVRVQLVDRRVAEGGVDVRTQNGPLTLVLPASVDGRLEASTQNGPISTNLDVDIHRPHRYAVSGEIDATLGQGGGTIRARTSNGPLTVRTDD